MSSPCYHADTTVLLLSHCIVNEVHLLEVCSIVRLNKILAMFCLPGACHNRNRNRNGVVKLKETPYACKVEESLKLHTKVVNVSRVIPLY